VTLLEARTQREDVNFRAQVSLELGGKSPNIVFESADLEQGRFPKQDAVRCGAPITHSASFRDSAAMWAALGLLYNTGKGLQRRWQTSKQWNDCLMRVLLGEDCTAGSRVYVQDSVYDNFVGLLIEKVKSTPIGDGFDEAVTCGPIVSDRARGSFRDLRYLTQNFGRSRRLNSIRFGATSSPGNRKVPRFWSGGGGRHTGKGYFVDPTGEAACAYFVNRDLPEMLTHLGKSSPMFSKT